MSVATVEQNRLPTAPTKSVPPREPDDAALPRPRFFRGSEIWAPLVIIPLVGMAVLWVYLTVGLPQTFDSSFHILRVGALDRHLHEGLFFPRWLPEMLLGYGYPLLNYYAPTIYYFAELWHLLGASVYWSIILTSLTTSLVAGFGAYLLALDLFKRRQSAALIVAATYMLAPYLMINIFNRGAMGEALAQALVPWVLWSAGRIFTARDPRPYAAGAVILLAFLATMHTITLFYAPALVLIYVLLSWRMAHRADAREGRRRALWAAGAILCGMAVSAFFWMPLLLERAFVSDRGFEIARDVMLQSGIWRWDNFLDLNLIYQNVSERPVQLGLLQLLLAALGLIIGFWQGMRNDWRWWFWIGVTTLFALLLTRGSLPLWENTLLAATQFPWRVLSMLSLPLALFAGAIVLPIRRTAPKVLVTAAMLLLIVYAQTPRIADKSTFAASSVRTDAAVLAMLDLDKGVLESGENNSSIQEFRPIWAPDTIDENASIVDVTPVKDGGANLQITPISMNATGITLQVTTPATQTAPTPLSFITFYFPGWRATLDGNMRLTTYPSEETGLLTVDIPASNPGTEHRLNLYWEGTALEKSAGAISLVAVLGIGIALLFSKRLRWFSLPLLLVAAAALWGWIWQSPQYPVQIPQTPQTQVASHGLHLLGANVQGSESDQPAVELLWQVVGQAPETLLVYMQVQNADGEIVGDAAMRPWYNTSSPAVWPVGAVVDDPYQLPLPSGLSASNYNLAVKTLTAEELTALDRTEALPVQFAFTLDAPVAEDPQPQHVVEANLGNSIQLVGYTAENANPNGSNSGLTSVVQAGDHLRITLFWRTLESIYNQNHAFIHLIDPEGNVLALRDQGPGPLLLSPEIWLPNRIYADAYQIYIPPDAPSGAYTPIVGQYLFATEERLPVFVPDDDTPAGEYRLPAVKVLNPPARATGSEVDARFGDFAMLESWRGLDGNNIQAGATYTITLDWMSLAPTALNYTRFVQIVDDANQIIGQEDGIPQNAVNPTWSWIEGERIADSLVLTIDFDAPAGDYRIITGLYDSATGERAAAHNRAGAPYADNAVTLATVTVAQ